MSIDYRYKGPMLREGMSLEQIREVKKQAMAHREWLLANMPPLKAEAEKRTVGGMGLDRRREVLSEAERRLIDDEKRWARAAEHNRAWIKEVRAMGEYHAAQKRAHMEAEYWAKQQSRSRGNYDPIGRFVNEIEQEINDGEGR
jgi:thioesterase domain-containing protein